MTRSHASSIAQALTAALLFGASAPLAKLLLGEVEPILLAALLYLGSGIGLLGIEALRERDPRASHGEARIGRSDLPWLAGAILAGGVAAPIVLLFSLRETPAATAALLLNLEGVATTLIAALAFKEAISRGAWWAIGLLALSGILLSADFEAGWGFSPAAFGIIAACVLWGLDNNLTRHISAKNPLTIVTVKGLAAGSLSLAMAILAGNNVPGPAVMLGAMLLGCLSYGVSIVLFIRAMRGLGAARTSALFGTAPLAGVALSLGLFREWPGWLFLLALPVMIAGTLLLLREQHEHHHVHEAAVHEHSHSHDDGHHDHSRPGAAPGMHSHVHQHDELPHAHHHMPDLHHRHVHGAGSARRKTHKA